MAAEAYDEDPYMCQGLALRIATDISSDVVWTDTWIDQLTKDEQKLTPPIDTTNPIVLSNNTCHEQIQRGIKQIYLGYITEKTRDIDVDTGIEILELGIMKSIPTIQSQSGFTVMKKNNIWRYSVVFLE